MNKHNDELIITGLY